MDHSYSEHLINEEYNIASKQWYEAEDRLKQCVECFDTKGALSALSDLNAAVANRLGPILTPGELLSSLLGIVGGILHFACRDAGLPPAYLTLMILWQKEFLTAAFFSPANPSPSVDPNEALSTCVLYACAMIKRFSLPDFGPLVKRSVTYIQQHLTDPIQIDDMASSLGVSRQHLSTQFHRETGRTPTEYINYERITLSKYYLRQNHLTITQIAHLCGYSDSNYFSRIFKSIMKETPGQYRKHRRTQHDTL